MTDFEKNWIEKATFKELLTKLRLEPLNSPWLVCETGKYLMSKLSERKSAITMKEAAAISKEVGWK